jgi:hypothetical protein
MRSLATTYDPTLYSADPYTADYGYQANPMGAWVGLALAVLMIVSVWKIFTKAGKPGWAAIIPFYNIWILLETVGRPGWWLLLYFIPFVNIVIAIIVALDLAKVFGKDGAYGFFLLFLFPFIGYPMLAFGSAKYVRPSAR